jgi:hypothetical protein
LNEAADVRSWHKADMLTGPLMSLTPEDIAFVEMVATHEDELPMA